MDIRPVPGGAITPSVIGAYEQVLGAANGTDFDGAVTAAIAEVVPSARFYMFESGDEAATHLRVAHYEPELEAILHNYLLHYRDQDPVKDAVSMLGQADVVLMRLTPEDIPQDGFRDQFFYERRIVERLSLVQRTKAGWRCMNISRHEAEGVCSDVQLSHFVTLAQLILPMMSRHWPRVPVAMPGRKSIPALEARFAERHPNLTLRERQVCARGVIGMSVEGTALDLGVAASSVITYRKRAYARLQISGPYELAGLVMH
jgi:DNA-binding CsgD family transcriptional regulator